MHQEKPILPTSSVVLPCEPGLLFSAVGKLIIPFSSIAQVISSQAHMVSFQALQREVAIVLTNTKVHVVLEDDKYLKNIPLHKNTN